MPNAKKGVATQKATTTTATATVATLQHTGDEITYAQLWAFINGQAGGNLHNVQVVPLGNVQLDQAQPVPFGFNGKVGGVRHTIQSWLLYGIDGNTSLAAILKAASKLGHSAKKPNCLLALLNGGYSPSYSQGDGLAGVQKNTAQRGRCLVAGDPLPPRARLFCGLWLHYQFNIACTPCGTARAVAAI